LLVPLHSDGVYSLLLCLLFIFLRSLDTMIGSFGSIYACCIVTLNRCNTTRQIIYLPLICSVRTPVLATTLAWTFSVVIN
jgi:hypothetical protein